MEKKPASDRAMKAQARTFLKDIYEIYDGKSDSFHEIGVANNTVMQGKLDKTAAEMT